MKKSLLLAIAFTLGILCVSSVNAEVTLWPVPEGETPSALWKVQVNGSDATPLSARTADPPFEKYNYGGEYAFLSLDADERVKLKITPNVGKEIDALTVRPLSLGIKPTKNEDGSFSVDVDKPCQFSVEYNGREHPLLVFVNPPEKDVPNADDPNVVYYGPGVHEPEGGKVELTDNQTLYLAPGTELSRRRRQVSDLRAR